MNKLPKVIDLFSGCGGLALGFEKAGFEIVAGIELMKEATETISYNLDYRYGKDATHICGDITEVESSIFADKFGDEGCIVIGGPPCQAYSMAGRGKLKSLGEDRAHTNDARGFLFKDFLRFALELNARAVVMENVPEATAFGDMNVPEIVCKELEENDYIAFWTILNAADFGVPQVRERIILFAIKNDENKEIIMPQPTNMNVGIDINMQKAKIKRNLESPHFVNPIEGENIPAWITVEDAFSDLPELFKSSSDKYKQTSMNVSKEYSSEPINDYQKTMRNWYGYQTKKVTGNVFRNTERDFQIFEMMNPGDNYSQASEIADKILEQQSRLYGITAESNVEEYEELKKKIVPVYDRGKFDSKWRKLRPDAPSHTLVAHLCKDTYSHIHPWEPRGISVREAARLQSFPDDFYFSCSMGDAYKQIGNAVPPLLAYGVAKVVYEAFMEGTDDNT
ncbi:MAG: DNA cytosine methyltransferase [Clostridiales bacterium]|nr:DNA cytosine methyltransferase [Clostridiales bacterium]